MNSFLTQLISINTSVSSRATGYLWLLIAIMVALFLQAYMHNFNIVYITLFTVFSLAISGCYFGRKNLYYISLVELPQGRIFAMQNSTLKWRVINKASNPAYDVRFSVGKHSCSFKSIEQNTILTLNLTFEKRGIQKWPEVTLDSRFPLPHVRFFKIRKIEHTLMVYPQPRGVPLKEYLKEQLSNYGERSDFEGLRRYEKSDIPSLIHWPSLAKGYEMMSRNFSYTAKLETLHFDFAECAKNDEDRVSQLCLWVLECEKQGRDFTIAMPTEIYSSKKEPIDEILQKLAQY